MIKLDPYKERFEGSQFFRIYEILWNTNILNLNEFDNMEEYKYIAFDILDLEFSSMDNYELSQKIATIFKYWLGHKINCTNDDYLKLSKLIKEKIKK